MKIRIDILDKMFSQVVRQRANGRCEFCGAKKPLQCSHFIGRRYRGTRYELDNTCGICYSCHNFFHEHPAIHTEFFLKRLGSERLESLQIQAERVTKIDREELKKKLKALLTTE